MGRVHKKKIAQYQKDAEAAEADEHSIASGSKDDSGRADMNPLEDAENDEKSNGNISDPEGEDNVKLSTSANATVDSKKDGSIAGDSNQPSEHEDDSDADGAESENESEEKQSPNKNGKRTAAKRKATPKKAQGKEENDDEAGTDADAEEDDDVPVAKNGGTPAKRGRKPGAKAKSTGAKRGRKPKAAAPVNNKDEEEEDEDDAEDEEEEYEVKDIVDHKVEKGVKFYLIRWKGYTKDDDTWESEETLSCQDIIDKYNKKNSTKGGTKSSPAKKEPASRGKKGRGRPAGGAVKKDVDPDKEWEVEKIIDYAEEKQGRVFRIRWKGYGPKFDTWEPQKHLSCDDLIDKFMKKINSMKDVSFKHLRETPKKTKRLLNETAPRSDASSRKSKRAAGKKRIMYADSDE